MNRKSVPKSGRDFAAPGPPMLTTKSLSPCTSISATVCRPQGGTGEPLAAFLAKALFFILLGLPLAAGFARSLARRRHWVLLRESLDQQGHASRRGSHPHEDQTQQSPGRGAQCGIELQTEPGT